MSWLHCLGVMYFCLYFQLFWGRVEKGSHYVALASLKLRSPVLWLKAYTVCPFNYLFFFWGRILCCFPGTRIMCALPLASNFLTCIPSCVHDLWSWQGRDCRCPWGWLSAVLTLPIQRGCSQWTGVHFCTACGSGLGVSGPIWFPLCYVVFHIDPK